MLVVILFGGHSYNSVSITQLDRLSLGASNSGDSQKLTTKHTQKMLQSQGIILFLLYSAFSETSRSTILNKGTQHEIKDIFFPQNLYFNASLAMADEVRKRDVDDVESVFQGIKTNMSFRLKEDFDEKCCNSTGATPALFLENL